MLPRQMHQSIFCSVIKMICGKRLAVNERFQTIHITSDTHNSRTAPHSSFQHFLLLRGAVSHRKVTNLDTVHVDLGFERKCKIQLQLQQQTQISGYTLTYTLTKISQRIEWSFASDGSGETLAPLASNPCRANHRQLFRANLSSAVIASLLSGAPW